MKKNGWLIPAIIVAANALAIACKWNDLPETIPAHFNLQGEASGTMQRTLLPFYPILSAAVCLVAYFITLKAAKLRTGTIILASGISLVVLLSTFVTLTYGKIPVLMLGEPAVLLIAVVASVICTMKSRKKYLQRNNNQ